MRLFLALSCLQGRPMQQAFDDLVQLEPDGMQLTPGNAPTESFAEHVADSGLPSCTHHGFHYRRLRQPVWSSDAGLLCASTSVHPPSHKTVDEDTFFHVWEESQDPIFEVMYGDYALGPGERLNQAMDAGISLAVDICHIEI